ncbi:hypothetical protein NP233_g6296 [Leucocoprinus birnbaumii]|uniref:F-box domain-containing protein n=1 Tax=Leucocoprinus birnbaumii TaxID=56174 RepID=A0AAD5YQ53_9AGAR|nr:hypothetical protein NP233_g6296 [Leucocoprinus birnbaumii]
MTQHSKVALGGNPALESGSNVTFEWTCSSHHPRAMQKGVLSVDSESETGTSAELLLDRALSLEGRIRELQEERARCLREANSRQVTTNVLPNEILATIFSASCPPIDFESTEFTLGSGDQFDEYIPSIEEPEVSRPDKEVDWSFRHFPLVISAVCALWRQVALSTPQLWTSLSMKITHRNIETKTDLLRFYIQHSRDLRFSLKLEMWRFSAETHGIRCTCGSRLDKMPPDTVTLGPLRAMIFEDYVDKFQVLRLAHPPIAWAALVQKSPFVVEDFAIGWSSVDCTQPNVSIVMPASASLRRLSFDSTWWSLIPPVPSNVTVVHLHAVDVCEAIHILYTCPQLVEYSYREPVNSGRSTHPQILQAHEPLVLANMEIFEWSWCDLTYHYDVTAILRLPRLLHLRWSRLPQDSLAGLASVSEPSIREFFSHLPEHIETFEFYDMIEPVKALNHPHTRLLYHMFAHLPRLRTLGFIQCDPRFIDFFFTSFWDGVREPQNLTYLSDLEVITIRDMGYSDWNFNPYPKVLPTYEVGDPFIKFIRAQGKFAKSRALCVEVEGCLISCYQPFSGELSRVQKRTKYELSYRTEGQVSSFD